MEHLDQILPDSYVAPSAPLLVFFPSFGSYLLEDGNLTAKTFRSLIAAGLLSTLVSLYAKGELPSLQELLTPRYTNVNKLDLKDWINAEKTLPFITDGVAYLPLLSRKVSVTAYTPTAEETDHDPNVASCGRYDHILRSGLSVIALSRDLFFHPELQELLGKKKPMCGLPAVVLLPDGRQVQGVVMDTMNPRFKERVDIMIPLEGDHPSAKAIAKSKALEFGVVDGARLTVFLPLDAKATREALISLSFLRRVESLVEGTSAT